MRVQVDAGAAFFSGYMYENTAPLPLTVPLADNNRIDRVVVRLNLNEDQRNIRAHIKQGTEDEPPELQRDEWIYELSIARINVIGGQSFIEDSQIADERYDEDVCGLVRSLLDLNVDEAMEHIDAEIQRFRDDFSNVRNFPIATNEQAIAGDDNASYMTPMLSRVQIRANTPIELYHNQAIPNGTKELEVPIPQNAKGVRFELTSRLNFNIITRHGSNNMGIRPYLRIGNNTEVFLFSTNMTARNILGGWDTGSSANSNGWVIEKIGFLEFYWSQNNHFGNDPNVGSPPSQGPEKIKTVSLEFNNSNVSLFRTTANVNLTKMLKIVVPQETVASANNTEVDCSFRTGSRLKVWAIYDDWRF